MTHTENSSVMLCVATDGYADTWDFCIRAQNAYCQRYGIDFLLKKEPTGELHPKWSKLAYVKDLLEAGTNVLMIDADAEPTHRAPDFRDLLRTFPQSDIFYSLGISGRPNSGVMVFRGGRSSAGVELLKLCFSNKSINPPREDRVRREGENGHIIQFLKHPAIAAFKKEIPNLWNSSIPDLYDLSYIRHYTNHLRKALSLGQLPLR